jgi:hypothetical protein
MSSQKGIATVHFIGNSLQVENTVNGSDLVELTAETDNKFHIQPNPTQNCTTLQPHVPPHTSQ